MSEDGIDMDPRESDLHIGIEVEYPVAPNSTDKYTAMGRKSNDLKRRVRDDGMPSGLGRAVGDPSVGLEIVAGGSGGMPLEDAPQVYADILEVLEEGYNTNYAPTSLLNVDSTAGLHVHLSPLSHDQARELFDISLTPWGQALFCTGIVSESGRDDWRVFRDSRFVDKHFDSQRYSIVNNRGADHWEWRTPEPMDPSNFEILIQFLRLFEQDVDSAIEFGQELLNEGDDRLTSIRRAEEVGMDLKDIPAVERQAAEVDDEGFFSEIWGDWSLPEIYHVHVPNAAADADHFYAFDSRIRDTLEVAGVEFSPEDVLYADTLEPVGDDALRDEISRALNARDRGTPNKTEATDVVEQAVKKKKGK